MSHLNAIFRPCAIVLAAAVLAACATPDTGSDADSARVRIPPRVDLGEWNEVGTLVLLIALTVWAMDVISARVRARIV